MKHDLIKSVLPTAIFTAIALGDYATHNLPGYSIGLRQHGLGEFFMNFGYSGGLIDLSVYPTCGNEVDISQMDMTALQAYYA